MKLREAFREAFTLALGFSWPWGGAQSCSSTVRTHILSDPRKSWVSLGKVWVKLSFQKARVREGP